MPSITKAFIFHTTHYNRVYNQTMKAVFLHVELDHLYKNQLILNSLVVTLLRLIGLFSYLLDYTL